MSTGSLPFCLLVVLAFVSAALAQPPAPAPAPDPLMGNAVSTDWYRWHGWLMWVGFGVLMPIGIIISRHLQAVTRLWFHLHWVLQMLAICFIVPAFAIAVNKFDVLYDSTHSKLGIAIVSLALFQPILGLARPHRGTRLRVLWYFVHWMFGTAVVILAWYNILKGMDLYEGDWGANLDTLKAWFATWIAVLAFVYLLLGRWQHLWGQAAIDGQVDGLSRFPSIAHVSSMMGFDHVGGSAAAASAERVASEKKLGEERAAANGV